MTKRSAILMLAMGMCMGLATPVTTISVARPQDDKTQTQDKDKVNHSKMSGGKMDHRDKMGKKKAKKHKKDEMNRIDEKK